MLYRKRKTSGIFFGILFLGITAILGTGCETPVSGSYTNQNVYSKAVYGQVSRMSFEYEGPGRNPVIVIHGLLGARLSDRVNKQNIWGDFSLRDMAVGNKLRQLSHPMGYGKPLNELTSSVYASALLGKSEIKLMGLGFDYQGYDILVDMLEASGYPPDTKPLPNNKNYYTQFIFYYDWRRDISENAEKLKNFMIEKKKYLQAHYAKLYDLKDYDIKFDIVAHSMGGLVAQYFMRYGGVQLPVNENEQLPITWEGCKYADRFIIIATPNAGYVDTLIELTKGLKLAAAAPTYPTAMIGTFPSFYQMLPDLGVNCVLYKDNEEPVDYLQIETWKRYKWGLADPSQDSWLQVLLPEIATAEERKEVALNHLSKCLSRARQFKQAMGVHAVPPDNVELILIAGDALETNHTVTVDRNTGNVEVLRKDSGDGKVTATSARLDLRDGGMWFPFMFSPIRWKAVYYLQGGHMGIMNSEVFASNLRYLLLAAPTKSQLAHAAEYLKTLEEQ